MHALKPYFGRALFSSIGRQRMRQSLIPEAKTLAEKIVSDHGKDVEFLSLSEIVGDFLKFTFRGGLSEPVEFDEAEEFLQYVDYLVSNSEIEVHFTGGEL
jgi:hypothetical protein